METPLCDYRCGLDCDLCHARGSHAVCTTLREEELQQIFPVSNHGESGSAVLLPMQLSAGEGVLCIGSRDPQRFSNDMDTLFVTYIADVLSKVLTHL